MDGKLEEPLNKHNNQGALGIYEPPCRHARLEPDPQIKQTAYTLLAGNSMIEVIITHGGKKWRRGARPGRWNIYGSIIMEIICSPL